MTKVTFIIVVATIILTAFVTKYYLSAAKRQGTIVIPAGNTYLGPNAPLENK